MDPDESTFSRIGRTFWDAWAYITTNVVRLLRTETNTARTDVHSDHEDSVARETVPQKYEEEHLKSGATELETAVGLPITDAHGRLPTIPLETCEVVTGHHDKKTKVYSAKYSKHREEERALLGGESKQETFGQNDGPKQETVPEDGENEEKRIQDFNEGQDHYTETPDITLTQKEHVTRSDSQVDTLSEKVHEKLRYRPEGLVMSNNSAAENSGNEGVSEFHGGVRGQEGAQEVVMVVQEPDHGDGPETSQSCVSSTEQAKAASRVILTEEEVPLSDASLTNQEVPMTATLEDHEITLPITTLNDQEEVHTLTHRLEKVVETLATECEDEEVRIQEVKGENDTQVSVSNLTCVDEVDSIHTVREQQEQVLHLLVEPVTVEYREDKDGTEASWDEEHECGLQDRDERLGGKRTEGHLEKADELGEESDEIYKKYVDEGELGGQITEDKKQKTEDEEMVEQELVNENDPTALGEEKIQGQFSSEPVSATKLHEKVGDLEDAMEEESGHEDDTGETTDEYPCEEVEEDRTEEDYGGNEMAEAKKKVDAAVLLQDPPTAAQPVIVADTTQITSEMSEEDQLIGGQHIQETGANAQEMKDVVSEVTDIARDHRAEEQRKAEPPRGEVEEEEKDEFEDLRRAEESEDEGVSIDHDDTEVPDAHEWYSKSNSEGEGDHDFIGKLQCVDPHTPTTEEDISLASKCKDMEEGVSLSSKCKETEKDIGLTSKREDTELAMLNESQMDPLESNKGAGASYSSDHTPEVPNTTSENVTANYEFVEKTSRMVSSCDASDDITSGNSDSEGENSFLDISDLKPKQQEEGELKINMKLSSKSELSDDGNELESKELATTTLADLIDEKELRESDGKLTCDMVMGSELVDVPTEINKLIMCTLEPEAEPIEVTEEQVKKLVEKIVESSRAKAQEMGMETDLQSQPDSENTTPETGMETDLPSEPDSENTALVSRDDVAEEQFNLLAEPEEGESDLSEKMGPNKGASNAEGRGIEPTSVEGIMVEEMDYESDVQSSEGPAASDESLCLGQEMIRGEEATLPTQKQADINVLQSDQQIFIPKAETRENQKLTQRPMEEEAQNELAVEPQSPESMISDPGRGSEGKLLKDPGETQAKETGDKLSMSSDENNENSQDQKEEKVSEISLAWGHAENKSEVLEKGKNESKSLLMNKEMEFETAQEEGDGIPEAGQDTMEEDKTRQEASLDKTDLAKRNDQPDVKCMAIMKTESGETSDPAGRSTVKRKFEQVITKEGKRGTDFTETLKELSSGDFRLQVQVPSLDFSIQKSRLSVKNPLVRRPKDPRTLLNLPSLDPSPGTAAQQEDLPGHPDKKPPAFRVPMGGIGVMGVKLPMLGAGLPVLRKTNREPKEEENSESSSAQKSEAEAEQRQTEDSDKGEVQTQSKPKWKPPRHAVGMGNPFMMAELKGKLKKTPKE